MGEQDVMIDCKYALALSDGSEWVFAATKEVSGWLYELAHTMGLRPAKKDGTHYIYFSGEGDLKTLNPPVTIGDEWDREDGWRCFRKGGTYRIWRHDTIPAVHMVLNTAFVAHPEIKYINMWSALREIYKHSLSSRGTPVHAALVSNRGRGILIAASGGTGKSTCCRRLPKGTWQVHCDDQALVLKHKKEGFKVHPFPTWSDHLWRKSKKSCLVEYPLPLSAIFFLEQASKDSTTPFGDPVEASLSVFGAAKQVWEPYLASVSKNEKKNALSMLFKNTSEIASSVYCFRLSATLSGEFWKEMEAVLDRVTTKLVMESKK